MSSCGGSGIPALLRSSPLLGTVQSKLASFLIRGAARVAVSVAVGMFACRTRARGYPHDSDASRPAVPWPLKSFPAAPRAQPEQLGSGTLPPVEELVLRTAAPVSLVARKRPVVRRSDTGASAIHA